jgi:cytochrome c
MNKLIIKFAMLLITFTASHFSCAEEFATKSDAEAIVKRAIEHVKKVGMTQSAEDFTNRKGDFVKSDLYVTMYDLEGLVLAHGQNRKSVGKNLIEQKDVDGKEYIRERMVLAKTKNKFWQDFKFSDPITKKVLPKEMYCETLPNAVVCAGVYKR